jgi:hypothetical protein
MSYGLLYHSNNFAFIKKYGCQGIYFVFFENVVEYDGCNY